MKYIFDDAEEQERSTLGRRPLARGSDPSEKEITLGTRSILGIFFGLILICGVFFGLGYSVGRGSNARTVAETAPPDSSAAEQVHPAKPSAGETLSAVEPAPARNPSSADNTGSAQDPDATDSAAPPSTGAAPSAPAPKPVSSPLRQQASAPVAAPPPLTRTVVQPETPPPSPVTHSALQSALPAPALQRAAMVQTPASNSYMVQVAAVRAPQAASILVTALEKRGFSAAVHSEAQDQLLHVQLGPFSNRADADAMRSRLIANGYNAVVK